MTTEPQSDLPFEPTLDSLSLWLANLPQKERERYASLFSGLQALNEAKLEPGFHLKALEKLRTPVVEAAANLTTAFLGKPLPLEPGVRKLAKLSAQFHAELAQGYYQVAQAKAFGRMFSAEEQGKIVHRAMRAYAQMLLRLALMYEASATSTWLRLNELYRLADRANLLESADPCPELAQPALCSVEQIYLRLLLFRLAAPYRLGQADIQKIFDLLQQHSSLVSLGHFWAEAGKKADFAVDLGSGAMPCSLARGQGEQKGDMRYLFLGALRSTLAALGKPPLNKDSGVSPGLSNHLQIHLGEGLEFLPDKKSRASTLFVGYTSLVGAMSKPETKPGFTLQSLDEHILPLGGLEASKTTGTFQASPALANQPPGLALGQPNPGEGLACRVYPANAPGFYIVEAAGLQLRPGQLLGLFTDNKLIQFGMICPGVNESAPSSYGFELLAVQVSLVTVRFDASLKKTYSCFFSSLGNHGRYSLITEPLRLRGGDGMSIQQKSGKSLERYRIAKKLEKNAGFCQYEIVPEAPE